ncbi:MAG: DEAD/DEAH box helicase family protein [Acidobacteria bacterium]|nr:DEAD/DEAH box helicase family protein [Acidobacteriota bacterium]
MSSFEVQEPIQNSPFEKPQRYWYIQEGETPQLKDGRRPSVIFPPRDQKQPWQTDEKLLRPSQEYPTGYELVMVNLVRERLEIWQKQGYPGVSRTTLDLITWWIREGREQRLFFAQLEAALSIIFLTEARADFLQGIAVPRDEPSDDRKAQGYTGFQRYACKMATGSGKTTVMAMLAAWSILNKVNNRSDARFSDVVLVICPNVTIRRRLAELDPKNGDASIYRTRDLVPPHLMPSLTQGPVLVTNWHVFEPQTPQSGGVGSKVMKAGVPVTTTETINIAAKTTTARGSRYLSFKDYEKQVAAGMLDVAEEIKDAEGNLKKIKVRTTRYVESDTSLINRVLGREVGGKQNILVLNDEAHHAYRIRRDEPDPDEEDTVDEDADEFFKEATVWIDGLDKVQKLRGINLCVDLSATPYFLGRVGQETNKSFPWVVSDFGLIDAIESGLVKIPQLAVRDTMGDERAAYFNIWKWMMEQKLTPAERGGRKGTVKPEAVLKYAHHPIAILGGEWEKKRQEWEQDGSPRPPVFILVCKNTSIAKVFYEWLADDKKPVGIPTSKIEGFRNREGNVYTIRVDTKVVHETDTGEAKSDESRWMRLTLDTVGKTDWPRDSQGREIYPDGFEELAGKLERPKHPPGRDIRCIVSVGMLTEGWDCNTVTHIIGLRPFMSQLLCEQVVGRGLRRASYELGPDNKFTEEVSQVLGVPFEVIPFKASQTATPSPRVKRFHVHALPQRADLEIKFPRVEGYTQAIRNKITVDWAVVPTFVLTPEKIPPEAQTKGLHINTAGKLTLSGPGYLVDVNLKEFRRQRRQQELIFDLASAITRMYVAQPHCEVPGHALFPQLLEIVQRYLQQKVEVRPPAELIDLFLAPYYGWLVERLLEAIRPDTSQGEAPEIPLYEKSRREGSTAEVDYWTSREAFEIMRSHVNYVVPDTKRWEQSAAYYIDKHPSVVSFVKNAGLGFAIPYLHNGQPHDYMPDFVIRLKSESPVHMILETKGYDPLEEVKREAAERWVAAVNAEGSYGRWLYRLTKKTTDISALLSAASVRD